MKIKTKYEKQIEDTMIHVNTVVTGEPARILIELKRACAQKREGG